ncbi:MAG TPA: hypothetical protein VJ124_06170 [Pyrinomonadaceae bacterium]|nr:hypothetical protein [Pyrinomonadaceae bacterium]
MVRQLPAPIDGKGRVETGAVKFGDDWPGLFIRGDNTITLRRRINDLLDYLPAEELQNNWSLAMLRMI